MRFHDAEASPPTDVTPFVNYMEPEFLEDDDDGSDLPLPDLAQLVPAPSEPSGRRSRPGRPLRDTIEQSDSDEGEPSDQNSDEEFGEGLAMEGAAEAAVGDLPAAGPDTGAEDQGGTAKKPRGRRRRRNRNRANRATGDTSSQTQEASVTSTRTSEPSTEANTEAVSGSADSERRPARRRRRRRRRRGGGKGGAAGAQDGQAAAASDDAES